MIPEDMIHKFHPEERDAIRIIYKCPKTKKILVIAGNPEHGIYIYTQITPDFILGITLASQPEAVQTAVRFKLSTAVRICEKEGIEI